MAISQRMMTKATAMMMMIHTSQTLAFSESVKIASTGRVSRFGTE